MFRSSYKYRALHCYVVLSLWIILLVAGMYKYIGVNDDNSVKTKDVETSSMKNLWPTTNKINVNRFCNFPGDITFIKEGKIKKQDIKLEGILMLIRHGDQGPLSHIRNVDKINCSGKIENTLDDLLLKYENFIQNTTLHERSSWSQIFGPLHQPVIIPTSTNNCKFAQLTRIGIQQMLKTGILLRSAYYNKLNFVNNPEVSNEIIVYSTRYQRTVQSVIALLYAFFQNDELHNIVKIAFHESQSLTFCNDNCVCPAAEKFYDRYMKELKREIKSNPVVQEMMFEMSEIVFEMSHQLQYNDLLMLHNALLTYVCHNAPLPCTYNGSEKYCVQYDRVNAIFSYSDWLIRQYMDNKNKIKHGLLRAYGLLYNIVSHILKIISGSKPKIVIYSGHDRTLEYLSIALGINTDQTVLPHYASRIIIEIYKNSKLNVTRNANNYYFRLLFNGKDLTGNIFFCKTRFQDFYEDNDSVHDSIIGTKIPIRLCPVESIIRHLHDNYFNDFNATNFKDACSSN